MIKNNSGSTLPAVPLILTIILGVSALGIDMSRAFILREQIQASADAAALAGASMTQIRQDDPNGPSFEGSILEIIPDQADAESEFYFNQNIESNDIKSKGIKILEQKGGTSPDKEKYSFYVRAQIPLIFGNFIGVGQYQTVSITADAAVAEVK